MKNPIKKARRALKVQAPNTEEQFDLCRKLLEQNGIMVLVQGVLTRNGSTLEAILSTCRLQSISRARHECWYVCYHHAHKRLSYPEMAVLFNRLDHTTIRSGCLQHKARIAAGEAPDPTEMSVGRTAAMWPDCLPPMLPLARTRVPAEVASDVA